MESKVLKLKGICMHLARKNKNHFNKYIFLFVWNEK